MGSRPVTDAEWDSLSPDFPNLDRSYTFWQAPETLSYNCIAWSMGITWTWIDPPSDQNSFTLLCEQTFKYSQLLPHLLIP